MNDAIKTDAAPILPESLLAKLWYEFGLQLGRVVLSLGFSMRVTGSSNVPRTGPVMVIANHGSFLDPYFVGVAVRRHLVFLARKTLFNNWLFGKFISSFNAVPIDQEGVGKEGIKTILAQLRAQKAVVVFPEGERTFTGKMQPLRPGIHLLIRRAECMVVPVGVAGAFEAYPRHRMFPTLAPLFMPAMPGTVAVCVGKPIPSRHYANAPREQVLQSLFDEIHALHLQAEALRRK